MTAISLDGPFLVSRAIVPAMRAARSDRIVNVSSSTTGGTTPGFVSYIAGKMAVIGLTPELANDLGDANITVSALALGLTRTALTERMWEGTRFRPSRRRPSYVEEPADIVGALSFLTSRRGLVHHGPDDRGRWWHDAAVTSSDGSAGSPPPSAYVRGNKPGRGVSSPRQGLH